MKREIIIKVDFFHIAMSQRCTLTIEKHKEQYYLFCSTKAGPVYKDKFDNKEDALTFALKYINQFDI